MDAKHCRGCKDDFYNHGDNSTSGRCWMRDKARLVTKFRIGMWTQPTQSGAFTEVRVPNCFREKGYAHYERLPDFVKREDVNVRVRR